MLSKADISLTAMWRSFLLPGSATAAIDCHWELALQPCTQHRDSKGGQWRKAQLYANIPWHNVSKLGKCQSWPFWFQRKPKKRVVFYPTWKNYTQNRGNVDHRCLSFQDRNKQERLVERNSCRCWSVSLHFNKHFSTLFVLTLLFIHKHTITAKPLRET